MATYFKTYTFIEGTTDTNLYGRGEIQLTIQTHPKENYSTVTSDLYFYGKDLNAPEDVDYTRTRVGLYTAGGIVPIKRVRDNVVYSYGDYTEATGEENLTLANAKFTQRSTLGSETYLNEEYKMWVYPGETADDNYVWFQTVEFTVYHELDGTCRLQYVFPTMSVFDYDNEDARVSHTVYEDVVYIDLPSFARTIVPTTAENFTDEGNPTLTYEAYTGESQAYYLYKSKYLYSSEKPDTITSLQVGFSFDGETIDIPYRDMEINGTSYTFEFTDAERDILRQKAQGSTRVPIYYMIRTVRDVYRLTTYTLEHDTVYHEVLEFVDKTKKYLTIVGCDPSLNPTVVDINESTLALTGDENTFVRYESTAEYAFNAVASKYATITYQEVQCGTTIIKNLSNGIIDNTESGTFVFYVEDSRYVGAVSSVFKNFVEYVKPTCYQKVVMEMAGEFDTRVVVTINGNYFDGTFGAVDNELTLQVRYSDDDGNMGDWITITDTPTFNGNTYNLTTEIEGFSYSKAYVFQCRAIDKLNTVESSQYTVRIYPVFDWGENDFNFNVPVNMNAENLSMNGETIIRHNVAANNTVLSATGGHVYIRPNGTSDTSGQTILYSNGDVDFSGAVNFGNSFTIGGSALADYIIETGEEAMGSNGTWYWCRWASGKAECWGCRNFGNMAITTAWGNLYRSAILTQDLPEDLFVTTPDVININIVNGNYGGWICKHENLAPSAVTTGSFIWVRPASATVSPTYIGFHVIGLWQ